MKPTPFQNPFVSKGELSKPLSKPTFSSGYELHPSLIAMVWAQLFLGHYNENPCHPGHDIGNSKVEIVSLLSHGEGEAMVHT